MFITLAYKTAMPVIKTRNILTDFIIDQKAEIDEKAVLIVVLVLGAMAGVETVTGAISGLLNSAAAGL